MDFYGEGKKERREEEWDHIELELLKQKEDQER